MRTNANNAVFNVPLKMNKDFVNALNCLIEKYGCDFETLNGFAEHNVNFSDFIDGFTEKNTTNADVTIDANANASTKDICGMLSEKGKPHDKLFAFNKLFLEMKQKYGLRTAREWLEQEYTGGYYLHDAPSATYKPYCYAYDLSRLAREGLFFLKHNYNAEPPKHLETFIDDTIEYISFMSNRSSGAVGIPNILIWTYYFWKRDVANGYYTKDPETYIRQAFQKLIYRLNQPFMRVDQTAFVNISVFDRNYCEALFGGLEYPDGSLFIDEIEGFIEHQKLFMEVVSDIRSENMFTFPVLTASLQYIDGKFADEEFARWCSDHNTTWNDSNFFISKDVTTLSNCCFGADQEIYFFTKDGEKVLTTFGDFVNTRLKNKNVGDKVIEKLETGEKILDPNSGELRAIKAISKLKNPTNKLITIELEDGRTLKVTPDQKIYDNNSKTLVEAIEIVKNPEKYDI